MNTFLRLFFIFFIYSVIGWFLETVYVSIKQHKLANRGFLIGPYCPIYGISAIVMITLLSKYKEDILILFIMGIFIASTLEYFTSYILEKLFKVRWWDYSNYFLNIDGRVCLLNGIMFGILCIILIKYINPFINNYIYDISENIINFVSLFLLILFIIDTCVSFKIIHNIEKTAFTKFIKKDYTEDISRKVRDKLFKESKSFRRILNAFPNFNFINKK